MKIYRFARRITFCTKLWTEFFTASSSILPFYPIGLFPPRTRILVNGIDLPVLCLTVILNFIFLMTNEVEQLLICLWATWIFSLVKCLFIFFAHFAIGMFSFLFLEVLYILWMWVFCGTCFINISPTQWFAISFFWKMSSNQQKFLTLIESI